MNRRFAALTNHRSNFSTPHDSFSLILGLENTWWSVIQDDLLPDLKAEIGALTPKLEKLIHILEWVRIEEYVVQRQYGEVGRPVHDRGSLANAFVAKVVLGLSTTASLIERLKIDRALRRICGFPMWKQVPNEATFSRAFAEFSKAQLPERVHEALVKKYLGEELIGHISRDGMAIEGREKPMCNTNSS